MCGKIGSGLIPGNAGFTSLRIATYGIPARSKIPEIYPCPAPYMQSIRNRNPDALIAFRSTKLSSAATYGGAKSISSIRAGVFAAGSGWFR